MERYDPYTDSWTSVSPALKYVSNFSAASCQGRLYLVGSSACKYNMLALQCYSPVTGGRASLMAMWGKCGLDRCRGPGTPRSLRE